MEGYNPDLPLLRAYAIMPDIPVQSSVPLDKPILDLTEGDLRELITNGVTERRDIEYKGQLPGTNDEAKKEFLADVSSFGNTVGGHLIFGIDEREGLPIALPGVTVQDFDQEKQRLESLLQSGIAPRLPGVELSERIALSSGSSAFVIRIPRSWNSPHMVSFRGRSAFYGRTSAGKYQLDVDQLRTAFALSQGTLDRIRDFRAERIAQIAAAVTPMKLARTPVVVVHVMPLISFETDRSFDSRELEKAFPLGKVMPAYSERGYSTRFNFEGFVIYSGMTENDVSSYLQAFRSGVIESVSAEPFWNNNNVLASAFFEGDLLRSSLPKYFTALQGLSVPPPFFVGVSLVGAEEFGMELPGMRGLVERSQTFGRKILIVPPIMVERYDSNLAMAMRPIFDSVWNAAGSRGSPYYDGDEWKGMKKFNRGASDY